MAASHSGFDEFQTIFNNGPIGLRKVGDSEGNVLEFMMRVNNNKVKVSVQSEAVTVAENWAHVAVTWDGDFAEIYVNGVPESSETGQGVINATTVQALIGRGELLRSELHPFSGLIDDVRIYNRALNAAEIKAQ